mgnify:FL=1
MENGLPKFQPLALNANDFYNFYVDENDCVMVLKAKEDI